MNEQNEDNLITQWLQSIDEFIIQDNAGGISLDGFKTALLVSPKIERDSIPNDVGQFTNSSQALD